MICCARLLASGMGVWRDSYMLNGDSVVIVLDLSWTHVCEGSMQIEVETSRR